MRLLIRQIRPEAFYAVAHGRNGSQIYPDWSSCKNAIAGMKGFKFKKFKTSEEAQNFLENVEIEISQKISKKNISYYALVNGINGPQIFTDWDQCKAASVGIVGKPKLKKFKNYDQAELFISQNFQNFEAASFYAVANGRNGSEIFENWEDCRDAVDGFSGSIYKKFKNLDQAKNYISKYSHNIINTEKRINLDKNDLIKNNSFLENR
jgi:viroplasmin and RNaseH domain-containing protein